MSSSGGVVSKIKKKLNFKGNYKEDRNNKEKKGTKSEKKISPKHKSYTVDCPQKCRRNSHRNGHLCVI